MFPKLFTRFFVLVFALSSAFLFAPRHNKKLVLSDEHQTLIRNTRNALAKLDRLITTISQKKQLSPYFTLFCQALKKLSSSQSLYYTPKQIASLAQSLFSHRKELYNPQDPLGKSQQMQLAANFCFCACAIGLMLITELSKFYKPTVKITRRGIFPTPLQILSQKIDCFVENTASFPKNAETFFFIRRYLSNDALSSTECSSDDEATSDHEDSRED